MLTRPWRPRIRSVRLARHWVLSPDEDLVLWCVGRWPVEKGSQKDGIVALTRSSQRAGLQTSHLRDQDSARCYSLLWIVTVAVLGEPIM